MILVFVYKTYMPYFEVFKGTLFMVATPKSIFDFQAFYDQKVTKSCVQLKEGSAKLTIAQ